MMGVLGRRVPLRASWGSAVVGSSPLEVPEPDGILPWWDPNEVGLSIIGAWRAINTPDSAWGNGPTSYTASLLDLSGNNNDLVEGNGAMPWAGATGWSFTAALAQYFDTGLIPVNDQSWSAFIQFANNVAANGFHLGIRAGVGSRSFYMQNTGANAVRYANGGYVTIAPQLLAGNLGVAGNQGYRDGVADGGAIGGWTGASGLAIYIGTRNNLGVPDAVFITEEIRAVAIYSGDAAAVQAEAANIAAAMALL